MKKWFSYILMIILCATIVSCSEDNALLPYSKGGGEEIVIRLGITSRSDDSGISGDESTNINNLKVWMISEDESISFYKEVENPIFDQNGVYTFDMKISVAKAASFRFYVLANSDNITNTIFNVNTTVEELKAAFFTGITGGDAGAIPMYGEYGNLKLFTDVYLYNVSVPIERVLSKLELYMARTSDDFTLKIKKATLSSIPKKGYVKSRAMEEMKKEEGLIDMDRTSILFEGESVVGSVSSSYEYADAQAILLKNAFIMENPYGKAGTGAVAELVTNEEETGDESFSYHLTIEYAVNDEPFTQTIRLPQVRRNTIDKIYCWVNENGVALELTLDVQSWNSNEEHWDYTETVTVKEEGVIKWADGSCNVRNEAEVYMIYATTAECTFTIDTPVGGMWYASLIPVSGNYDAFAFEGEATGEVGKPATLRIKTTQDDVTENSKAELQIVVRTIDGRTIVANNLLGESSAKTRYTLVQSK